MSPLVWTLDSLSPKIENGKKSIGLNLPRLDRPETFLFVVYNLYVKPMNIWHYNKGGEHHLYSITF